MTSVFLSCSSSNFFGPGAWIQLDQLTGLGMLLSPLPQSWDYRCGPGSHASEIGILLTEPYLLPINFYLKHVKASLA